MRIKQLLSGTVLAATLAAPFTADAAVQALTLQNPGLTVFQQTFNNPCVIGDNSCKNPAGFAEQLVPNNGSYDLTSPSYTVSQLTSLLGSPAFTIGIDVNSTQKPIATEQLQAFKVFVDNVLFAAYVVAAPGTPLFDLQQGNGFSDELIKGLDLTGVAAASTVTFEAQLNNSTDGQEQFFLIAADADPVAEPASIAVLGIGLLGLGFVASRRRRWDRSGQ